MITKNSLGTLKPIAAKLQKKDQDVFQAYSMIDDTIKAVARVRSNIEEECHQWFEDASRLADKIDVTVSVPRITGRQEHRNNAVSVNPESHDRVNVAIPLWIIYWKKLVQDSAKTTRLAPKFFPWFHLLW